MLGSKKASSSETNKPMPSGQLTNSIVLDTHIEGTISTNHDIRVDGSIKGNLLSKGKVIIGENGKIEGEIKCENAIIEGYFKGIIHVDQLLIVLSTAKIDGDVYTQKLQVEPGAIFNVKCTMGGQQIKVSKESPVGSAGKLS